MTNNNTGTTLTRQIASYASVGAGATLAHYAVLIALKEGGVMDAVPAALCGYVVGGFMSYVFNRRHTFASARAHGEAGWRFALVAALGFAITYALMTLLVTRWSAAYLVAQFATTVIVMFVTFFINRAWTFG